MRVTVYATAIAALVAAVLLRWLLDPLIGDTLPLVTLFGAVAAAVWVGGHRPAIIVAVVGYLACDYLFIQPRGEFGPFDVQNGVGLIAYVFTCSLIIAIGEAMRIAKVRAGERGELMRVTLGSIGDAVITTDTESRVTYLNAVAESLTGWSNAEALRQPLDKVFRIIDERTRQPIESPATRALRDNAVVALSNHAILIGKDGIERPIDDSAAPIKDSRMQVSGCVLIFRDISERRRWDKDAANQLRADRLLAAIVESSDDAIISKSLDGIIESWNASAERLFGYTAEHAVGRHISLVIPADRIGEEDKIIASLRAGQRVEHFETERVRSDGRRIPVSLTISPVRDEAGKVIGASKIVRDITDRKRAETEREKFATLVENSTDFIGICDLQGVPLYVNPTGLKMVGLEGIEQARRTHVRDFFFPEDQARVMGEIFPSVMNNGHAAMEIRFRNFQTGEARWMDYKILKLADTGGETVALATVSRDITERRRLEDSLRKLAADLSEADHRKDEFLATLSHELRNPLAPLRNMLEILKRAGRDDRAMVPQALDTMERQLGQLVRLVDDLLDLNRITHDRIELHKERVDLVSVVSQAVEATRPLAESGGQDLRIIMPREPIYLRADPVRLSQIFGNLLNNSCKFTNRGGNIEVTVERRGSEAAVIVKDNGIGIPRDKLDSIFDMFNQVGRSLERTQGGLGIGLALVRRLVQMHGGAVEATSEGQGQGSEFVVRLPIAIEGAAAAEGAEKAAAQEPALPRRILVVDDNRDAATSLATLLQITGHETFIAHDGPTALEAIQRHRPEVVLLDLGLPRLNGYEVCRRVRELPWGKDVTLVALTGWGQDADRRKSHEAGFDGHLVKPVEFAVLVSLLDELAAVRKGQ